MNRFASIAALAVTTFLAVGCTVVTNAPPPENEASGPRAPQTVVKPDADGRPANLRSGQNEAFWIWRGPSNDWHLRTTTAGNKHRFLGHIVGHRADITGAKSSSNENGDRIKYDAETRKVHFDFTTAGEADGVDFSVANGTCVDFELSIDGVERPDRIVVGAKEQRPTKARFTACH